MLLAPSGRPEPDVYIVSTTALTRARGHVKIDWLKRHELIDVIG